jgi:hypothetical protein
MINHQINAKKSQETKYARAKMVKVQRHWMSTNEVKISCRYLIPSLEILE